MKNDPGLKFCKRQVRQVYSGELVTPQSDLCKVDTLCESSKVHDRIKRYLGINIGLRYVIYYNVCVHVRAIA